MEQPQQEVAVEGLELVLAPGLLNHRQPVAQVVGVAVEKALLLNEVDEHQAVEHEGRVPLKVGMGFQFAVHLDRRGEPLMSLRKAACSALKRS